MRPLKKYMEISRISMMAQVVIALVAHFTNGLTESMQHQYSNAVFNSCALTVIVL